MDRRLILPGLGIGLGLLLWLLWARPPEEAPVVPPRPVATAQPGHRPRVGPSSEGAPPAPPPSPLEEALSVVAEAEGGQVIHCPSPGVVVGRHPFLRLEQVDGRLIAVVADASGGGLLYPAPPAPGSLPPGELGAAMMAVRTPAAWVHWSGERCLVDAVPERRLMGRVEGAPPGGTWLVGCGLIMAPTDEAGTFDERVPGGEPCVLEVEGRGGTPLGMDVDETDLVLSWTPPETDDPRDEVSLRLERAEAELETLEAMADPLDDALDRDLAPEVRALIEGWRAEDLALREQKRGMLLRALKRYRDPPEVDALTPP